MLFAYFKSMPTIVFGVRIPRHLEIKGLQSLFTDLIQEVKGQGISQNAHELFRDCKQSFYHRCGNSRVLIARSKAPECPLRMNLEGAVPGPLPVRIFRVCSKFSVHSLRIDLNQQQSASRFHVHMMLSYLQEACRVLSRSPLLGRECLATIGPQRVKPDAIGYSRQFRAPRSCHSTISGYV